MRRHARSTGAFLAQSLPPFAPSPWNARTFSAALVHYMRDWNGKPTVLQWARYLTCKQILLPECYKLKNDHPTPSLIVSRLVSYSIKKTEDRKPDFVPLVTIFVQPWICYKYALVATEHSPTSINRMWRWAKRLPRVTSLITEVTSCW